MAKFDFGLVGGLPEKTEEKKSLSEEEYVKLYKKLEALNERSKELLKLPKDKFISKKVQDEYLELDHQRLKIIKALLL